MKAIMSLFSTLPIQKKKKILLFFAYLLFLSYFWNPIGRGVALLCELTVHYFFFFNFKIQKNKILFWIEFCFLLGVGRYL